MYVESAETPIMGARVLHVIPAHPALRHFPFFMETRERRANTDTLAVAEIYALPVFSVILTVRPRWPAIEVYGLWHVLRLVAISRNIALLQTPMCHKDMLRMDLYAWAKSVGPLSNGCRKCRYDPNDIPRNTGGADAFRTFRDLRISWKPGGVVRIHTSWRFRCYPRPLCFSVSTIRNPHWPPIDGYGRCRV